MCAMLRLRPVCAFVAVATCASLFTGASARASDDAPAAASSTARPLPSVLRDDEDWTFLRDASRRSDPYDAIKYVPLDLGGSAYVSFAAEAREFYEHSFDQYWNAASGSNGYVLQRYLASADLHLGRLRTFVELESASDPGRRGGPGPNNANGLDATEAYVQYGIGGETRAFAPPLALQVGRFGLNAGTGRVLSVNDGPGVRNAFDGARAIVRAGGVRADLFAAHPVAVRTGAFDDAADASRSLVGAYVARTGLANATLEGYVLDDDRSAAYQRGRAHETRYTIGGHVGRTLRTFDGDVEASYQFGTFGRVPISAFSIAGEIGASLRTPHVTTRVSLGAGVASGDRGPSSATLGDYRPPTFKGQYLGAIGAIGPIDSVGFEPGVTATFDRRVVATVTYLFFARASRDDGIYGIAGNLLSAGSTRTAAGVASGPLFSVLDRLDAHASLQAIYQRSYAGASPRASPTVANIAYYRVVLDYKI